MTFKLRLLKVSTMTKVATHVEFDEQLVVLPAQRPRLVQRRADLHQVRLHLLDAHPDPLIALQRQLNRSMNRSTNSSNTQGNK